MRRKHFSIFLVNNSAIQWRMQKIFIGAFSFSGIWWSFLFGVRCLWRHNLSSYSYFQINVLAMFFDIISILFYIHSPYFMWHCTEYKLLALQVRISEKNILTLQHGVHYRKNIRLRVKTGGETHSSLRKSNLQLQNETAQMPCRIRAVEHRKCVAGPAGAHPGLHDRILQNFTRIENAHEARKKTFNFLLCIEVQQTVNFHFSLLRHYQLPESFHV